MTTLQHAVCAGCNNVDLVDEVLGNWPDTVMTLCGITVAIGVYDNPKCQVCSDLFGREDHKCRQTA